MAVMNGDTALPFGTSRPDFVITGATTSSGVCIIASRNLVNTELNVDFPRPEFLFFNEIPYPGSADITLTTRLRHFIVIDAPDYPSAMAGLFDAWRKQDEQEGRAPAIGGMPALEASDGAHGS
jgi:hypothetical protein